MTVFLSCSCPPANFIQDRRKLINARHKMIWLLRNVLIGYKIGVLTSISIFFSSCFFGSKPKALNATLSSLVSILPIPSVSNRSNASLMSFFCSSDSSNFGPLCVLLLAPSPTPDLIMADAEVSVVVWNYEFYLTTLIISINNIEKHGKSINFLFKKHLKRYLPFFRTQFG